VLKAPFPWFGGKSRVAHLVWRGFGDVPNYIEPFAGSLAVLLGRPSAPRIETVNDVDAFLSNFWRAVKWAPEEVAEHADWPVSEADLHARHRWLVGQAEFRHRMKHEPKFFDARIAGWWVWGICQWIGGGWCAGSNWGVGAPRMHGGQRTAEVEQRPHIGHAGIGVHRRKIQTAQVEGRPHLLRGKGVHKASLNNETIGSPDWEGRTNAGRRARGVQTAERRARDLTNSSEWHKRPSLEKGGKGTHRSFPNYSEQLPMLSGDAGASGRGVHRSGLFNKLPMISGLHGNSGRGIHASGLQRTVDEPIRLWMLALAERLRRVRVCCGDYQRVLGRSVTEKIGVTGIFFDPPYKEDAGRDPSLYAHDDLNVAVAVREWAVEHGKNPKLRIAYCSYGEDACPKGWERVHWKAAGGYAAAAGNTENSERETIDFSPHCELVERQLQMFAAEGR
jgi:hypothetical protein